MRLLMWRFFSVSLLTVLVALSSMAQAPTRPATVLATCGSGTFVAGQFATLTVDPKGGDCISGITGTVTINTSGLATSANQPSVQASAVDKSGSITLGGTAQTLAALNTSRKRISIQNYSTAAAQGIATAESLWISFTGSAVCGGGTGTFELTAGTVADTGSLVVSTQAVSVCAATTGHKWQAGEQ